MSDIGNYLWTSFSLVINKKVEDNFLRGVHRYELVGSQSASLENSIWMIEQVLKASGSSLVIPNYIKEHSYIPIVMTALLASKLKLSKNPKFKKTFNWINTYFTSSMHLVCLTASIGLIYLGKQKEGSITTAFIIYGFMQRRNLIFNATNENKLYDVLQVGLNGFRIYSGDIRYQLYGIYSTSLQIEEKLQKIRKEKKLKNQPKVEPFTMRFGEWVTAYGFSLIPNPQQSLYTLPPAPNVDLSDLKTLFKNINWQDPNYAGQIRNFVTNDEHWEEFHSNKKTDQELFDYIEKGLEDLIETVSNGSSRSAEFNNIQTLENRLKHILNQLQKKDKKDQAEVLIQLGLAGYYCPAGYRRILKDTYSHLYDYRADTIQDKLLKVLDFDKRHLVQTCFYEWHSRIPSFGGLKVLLNPSNQHRNDFIMSRIGDRFLLGWDQDAEDDETLFPAIPFEAEFWSCIYSKTIRNFKEQYHAERILEVVHTAFANSQIPWEQFERWFVSHIKDLTDENIFSNEDATNWVRDNVVEDFDDKDGKPSMMIKTLYLYYFLLKEQALLLQTK
jgi:hypothetical protein